METTGRGRSGKALQKRAAFPRPSRCHGPQTQTGRIPWGGRPCGTHIPTQFPQRRPLPLPIEQAECGLRAWARGSRPALPGMGVVSATRVPSESSESGPGHSPGADSTVQSGSPAGLLLEGGWTLRTQDAPDVP